MPTSKLQFSNRLALAGLTTFLLSGLAAPRARAQAAVWTNADDRDYGGNPPVFVAAYWSYGYVAPDANGNGGHAGNWSGNLVPGKAGGPVDVYLGAPGNTLCDVNVTLNSLTLAPGGALAMDLYSALTVTTTNFAVDGGLTFGGGTGGTIPAYTNAGTLTKSAGSGTFTIDPDFVFNSNLGTTVAAASGTLQLPGGGGLFDTVAFVPAAGATINLVAQDTASTTYGAHFQGTLSNGAGTGTVLFSGGTMSGGSTPCTLAFTGSVFQWTGGQIGSAQQGAVFDNAGVVNLSGDGDKANVSTFTNTGTMVQTGAGNFRVGNYHDGGSVTNAPGAVYDLQSDAALTTDIGNIFTNQGLFKKSGGTGTSTLTASFSNQGGTVEVDSGTLQMVVPDNIYSNSGVSTGGTFNVAAGALLDLGDGGHFTGTYTGGGGGTVRISQGTFYTDRMTGAVFNFPGAMLQWTGGTLGGYQAGQLFTNAGTLNLSGSNAKTAYDTFTNTGVMIQTGTGIFNASDYGGGGSFTNAAGATYDLQSDASIGGSGQPATNAGLLEKTAGSGVSSFSPDFINSGTVSVATGTLNFTGHLDDITGTTLTGGTWNVADGAALTFANYTGGITINQASVTLSGPNASFPAINALADNQGTFSLLALRQFTTAGDLSNEGTIFLDAGSTLHVAGNFTASDAAASTSAARKGGVHTQAATASTLSFVIGGTAAQGAQSPGVLQVAGVARMGGLIEIALSQLAATPNVTDSVILLSAGSVTGTFDNAPEGTRVPTTDGRGSFVVNYGATAIGLSRFLAPGQTESTPVVTVAVVGDGDAVEGGENGKVAIRRAGDITNALTVRYKVAGGVVAGVDYKPLPGVAVIPAGASQVKIKIKPIDDGQPEGTRIAKVKLKPATDGSYTLGSAVAAKVHILDND